MTGTSPVLKMQKKILAQNLVHYMNSVIRLTYMYTAFITDETLTTNDYQTSFFTLILYTPWQILHSIPLYIIEH